MAQQMKRPKSARPKPLAIGKLFSSETPYYWIVKLWDTSADMMKITKCDEDTLALCETLVEEELDARGRHRMPKRMGTLHFISGVWTVGIVAHEIQHAILHRLRYLDPNADLVLPEFQKGFDPEDEEVLAYESGDWVEGLMGWLSRVDSRSPYPSELFR